jgi:hypothetical protein
MCRWRNKKVEETQFTAHTNTIGGDDLDAGAGVQRGVGTRALRCNRRSGDDVTEHLGLGGAGEARNENRD